MKGKIRKLTIANIWVKIHLFCANFVLLDETRISFRLNFENANIRKILLCIFQCEFRMCLPISLTWYEELSIFSIKTRPYFSNLF